MNRNAIEIRNLTKTFGDFRLDSINLALPSGYIMGLIGENGAGKSTMIKAMLDIIKKDEGEVSFFGRPFDLEDSGMKEHIGLVLDDNNFPTEATAGDLEKIMSMCYSTWDSSRFSELLEHFRLPRNKRIKDFSRGMKMKISIAVALSHDSRLLILDEATSGLDPVAREEILDVFREFIQDEDHSILISSHILSDLEKICDYIAYIHNGRLVFCESGEELTDKYAVVKCSRENFEAIDRSAVVSCKMNEFGAEALVVRAGVNPAFDMSPAGIEDIMLYFAKEGVK
ncbi:MAG: ABC transporter ATP-binding protein [Lentihominibacter sp.]